MFTKVTRQEFFESRVFKSKRGSFKTIVDWRPVKRRHIDERSLPAGTEVLFREPGLWTKFRWIIIGGLIISAIELLLIVRLIREARRRRISESALKTLSGHLLTAQEDERARLARELHDALSQQVASLGIALSSMKSRISPVDTTLCADVAKQQKLVTELGQEARRISHDLHPPSLKLFGIEHALKRYCRSLEPLTAWLSG